MQVVEKLEAFFKLRAKRINAKGPLFENALLVHSILLNATFKTSHTKTHLRRPSIYYDGTPVVYSLKQSKNSDRQEFRMFVDPGGLGIDISNQIDLSIYTLDAILSVLCWKKPIVNLNNIFQAIIPLNAQEVAQWKSGIWLGMSLSRKGINLRTYINLRHGDAKERWQRIANVLSDFADNSFESSFEALIKRVSPNAIPVGLGVSISNKIKGFRLYFGMYQPNYKSIIETFPNEIEKKDLDLLLFCNSLTKEFGSFPPQSITLGIDFFLNEYGLIDSKLHRIKIDTSCHFIPSNATSALETEFANSIKVLGIRCQRI